MPQDRLSAEEDPATREEDEPLMPDSVLRRIDDDIALSERRSLRSALVGRTVENILEISEERVERALDEEARAQGRPRLRRQVTQGFAVGAYVKPQPLWFGLGLGAAAIIWVIVVLVNG
jgi:hypothetical protein